MPPRIEKAERAARYRTIAAFAALCLFFSAVEQLVPRPLPFFRIGLSNIPILLALDFMGMGDLLLLALLKSAGQGLVTGTLASYVFLFSAAGTLASLFSMKALKRLAGDRMSFIGLGTIGALASNAVQLALSLAFIFGRAAIVIAPLILGIGTVSGVLMGSFAQAFRIKSKWLARVISAWTGGLP